MPATPAVPVVPILLMQEAERIKAERVAAYAAKKANKPKTIAKVCTVLDLSRLTHEPVQSVVTLEVKPWDDETDMKALEDSVRSVEMEGLVWGASKLVPIGYGIRKLQITVVVGMHLEHFQLIKPLICRKWMNLYRSTTSRKRLLSLKITSRALMLPRCRVSEQPFIAPSVDLISLHRIVSYSE